MKKNLDEDTIKFTPLEYERDFGKFERKVYENGDVYEGQMKHGLPDGEGTMFYANGWHYVGSWSKGKREGRGSYYDTLEKVYEGIWKDDEPTEDGIYIM